MEAKEKEQEEEVEEVDKIDNPLKCKRHGEEEASGSKRKKTSKAMNSKDPLPLASTTLPTNTQIIMPSKPNPTQRPRP